MQAAEKLRAICQQLKEYTDRLKKNRAPRGRDFLDIHTICETQGVDFASSGFHETLRRVFYAKRVPLGLIPKAVDPSMKDFHSLDFDKIADTVRSRKELKSFDFYFDYVRRRCDDLEPLWDE